MNSKDYWMECVSLGAESCGLEMTQEQLECIAESVEVGHENYGMAFYSPPSSDRYNDIEREWKKKLSDLQAEFDRYRGNAEQAVGQALRQHRDDRVSIGEHGEVYRLDGRGTRIQ